MTTGAKPSLDEYGGNVSFRICINGNAVLKKIPKFGTSLFTVPLDIGEDPSSGFMGRPVVAAQKSSIRSSGCFG